MTTLVFVLAAECAWFYLVIKDLVAVSNPGLVLSPAVLAPYAAAVIVASGILRARQWIEIRCQLPSTADDTAVDGSAPGAARTWRTRTIGVALNSAVVTINVAGASASMLAVVWWELYRTQPLLDPTWIVQACQDAVSSADALPPLLWPSFVALFLWWRGVYLAHERRSFSGLSSRFMWGSGALVVLAAVGGFGPVDSGEATALLAIFLLLGMAALASARLEMAQTDRSGTVDKRWQGLSTAMAMVMVAIGILLALGFLSQLQALATEIRGWLFGYLLPMVLEILKWIIHLLGLDKPPGPLPSTGQDVGTPAASARREVLVVPEMVRQVLGFLFNLSWIVMILLVLYRFAEDLTWGRRRGGRGSARREPLSWSPWRGLQALLLRIVEGLLAWFPALARWSRHLVPPEDRASTAREVYRRLLAWGAAHGQLRSPSTTPLEYQLLLSSRWPVLAREFLIITESYLLARYGPEKFLPYEIDETLTAWASITSTRHL